MYSHLVVCVCGSKNEVTLKFRFCYMLYEQCLVGKLFFVVREIIFLRVNRRLILSVLRMNKSLYCIVLLMLQVIPEEEYIIDMFISL